MGQTLYIIGNIISLVIVLGLTGWLGWRALKRAPSPPFLIFKWVLTAGLFWFMFHTIVPMFRHGGETAIIGLLVAGLWGITMTILWRHAIIDIIANPISSLYDGGSQEIEPKPFYSAAIGKRKANRPLDAIIAIREQLDKFPNDYEGILLLASIQAEDTKDLVSAEITLNRFCDWEKAPPKQVAAALTQLADWHLKLAQDTDAAQVALERIIAKYPGSELAAAAAQRIAHLGGTKINLSAAHERQPFIVREGVKNAGLRETLQDIVPAEANPAQVAEELVKHLEQHPLDTEARERLAIIYARHFQRLDLAAIELEQLINQPDQPPKHVAHWLNLFADLQVQAGADYDTVRPTLEKIIERFPDLPAGERARWRLTYLKLEIKGRQKEPAHKELGEYEQNIGLKYGPTYGSPRQL